MTEKDYNICIGRILAGQALSEDTAQSFISVLNAFENLLDEGDQDDYFGTEGWRHRIWD
jgi:hypothetical protein